MVTSSTVTGFSRRQAHRQKAHGDAVIHMGGDRAAAGNAVAPMPSTVRRRRFPGSARHWRPAPRDRGQPVAFLDPQFFQPAHHGRAFGKGGGDGQDGIFVDHRGRALRRHLDALQPEWRTTRSPISSPPLARRLANFDLRAHFQQGLDQADAAGIEQDASGSRFPSPARSAPPPAERPPRRIARHFDRAAGGVRPGPVDAKWLASAPTRLDGNLRAERRQHLFGVIAGQRAFDDAWCGPAHSAPPAAAPISPGRTPPQAGGRSALDRRAPFRVTGISALAPCASDVRRKRPAAPAPAPSGGERSEASPVKMAVIGVVAIAPITRREPVPELPKSSHVGGLGQSAHPSARAPASARRPRRSASAPSRRRAPAVEYVVGFQQAGNAGFALRQRAQDQGPLGNGFVARHLGAALQRARCAHPGGNSPEPSWLALPSGALHKAKDPLQAGHTL